MKTPRVTSIIPVLVVLSGFIWKSFGATLYVWSESPDPKPPYTNWTTAARVIQDAVDAALAGDEIVVTNGVYATGGRAVDGTMTNRVAITKALTLRSVNGPEFTVIEGYQVPGTTNGPSAIRCVYLANRARLSGFTLTKGATTSWGSGGGVYCVFTNAVVTNCVLVGNSARYGGGASGSTLYNCIVYFNRSIDGPNHIDSTLNYCCTRAALRRQGSSIGGLGRLASEWSDSGDGEINVAAQCASGVRLTGYGEHHQDSDNCTTVATTNTKESMRSAEKTLSPTFMVNVPVRVPRPRFFPFRRVTD